MDTQFWGPSGHKLNHSIAYCYTFGLYKEDVPRHIITSFFKSEKYVLPCIYCRKSYSQYLKELPLNKESHKATFSFRDEKLLSLWESSQGEIPEVDPSGKEDNIFKWVYLLHNKINDKLRKQGYLQKKDPKYETVLKKYKSFVKKINCNMIGWNFLYSIVFEYPQYSFELSKARYNGYVTFFTNLKYILPCKRVRDAYREYIEKYPVENYMETRDKFKKWLYKLEKKVRTKCSTYKDRCDRIEKYRVKKCRNKSCRK